MKKQKKARKLTYFLSNLNTTIYPTTNDNKRLLSTTNV